MATSKKSAPVVKKAVAKLEVKKAAPKKKAVAKKPVKKVVIEVKETEWEDVNKDTLLAAATKAVGLESEKKEEYCGQCIEEVPYDSPEKYVSQGECSCDIEFFDTLVGKILTAFAAGAVGALITYIVMSPK